jgi:hypothetical protein
VSKSFAAFPVLLSVIAMTTTGAQQPARLDLANRLLDAIQFDRLVDRMGAPQSSSADTATIQRYRAFITKHLDVRRLRERAAAQYAELFTEEELGELVRFFESPAGRKYTSSQPKIIEAIQPIIAAVFREHFDEYRREVLGLP